MKTIFVVKRDFSGSGIDYKVGDIVPEEEVKSWRNFAELKDLGYIEEVQENKENIPQDLRKILFDKRLTERDKQVYFKLVVEDVKNKKEIASELGIGRWEVYRSITRLKRLGFL